MRLRSRPARWLGLRLALLALLVLSVGISATAQEPILIGAVGPLSQPGAVQAGLDMRWAIETAAADVNAAGGVLGRELRVVFYDTQNQPNVAASVAERLAYEDKVVAVVGEYHSGAALAQIPVYTRAGIPVVFSEVWSDAVTGGDPNDPNLPSFPPTVFRIAPTSSYAGAFLSDWLLNGLKVRKVIQIYEATDFGLSQARALRSQLEPAGVELVQIQVELNQPDYSAILLRLAQQHGDADAVVFDVTGESSYVVEQNAFEVGLVGDGTVPVANQVAQNAEAFWRAVPDGAGSTFQFVGLAPAFYNDLTRSVAERYEAAFGGPPKVWVFEAYDSVRLVADAIERAGSTDPEAIVRALETTSFVGAQGQYSFPYGSHNPVPEGQPRWLWHQWPNPPIVILEYVKRGDGLAEAAVLWPEARQTHGAAYVQP